MAQLASWLDGIGLGRHADLFAANDIDLDVLPELTEADLRELGLSLGDRKRLLAAVRALGRDAGSYAGPTPMAAPEPVATAADQGTPIQAARRQVTVLFADLTGFTEMATRLDAEEVHALLQRYFAVADEVVASFGGAIDKHIGDAVMAVFGAPVTHTDDPQRAVRAALEMHRRLAAFSPPLVAHVGIASGQVVASRTGSDAFAEYTVTGASVNLAARLQGLAASGETLISDSVHARLGGSVDCENAGDVEVKGFAEPLRVWRVRGLSLCPAGPDARAFVGRGRELRQLRGVIDDCLETRTGQLVLVRGEPGIGKTWLVDRLVAEAETAGFACHTGLVLDFGAGKGRDAVPALVRSLLGIAPGSDKTVRRALATRAVTDGVVPAEFAVHLHDLLDLPQPPPLRAVQEAMDHATRNRGLERTLATLACESGRRAPVLLRIEDIHWADPVLLDRLAGLAGGIVDSTVLMVMTTRVDGDPIGAGWRTRIRGSPLTTIDIGPLSEADAATLAESYPEADPTLAKACIERAAGNPLFLDQLLRSAREDAERGVPDSVQSIVQARMDKLDPDDRLALRAAAVLGQRFSPEPVAYMASSRGYDCAALVAHRLVRPEADGFLFVHALVRDGVYGTLLRDDRAALHARAAEWFAGRDAVLHARHLGAAGDPAAGAAYLAAARAELAAFRYEDARDLVAQLLRLAPPPPVRVEALCLQGELLRLLADSAGSIESYGTALTFASTPDLEVACRLGLAAGMRILDRFDDAFAELEVCETLSRDHGWTDRLAEIAFMRGNLCFPLGRTEDCLAAHTGALRHAREAGNAALEIQALGGLGDANYARTRIVSARRHFAECVDRARAEGLARIEIANAPMLAWTTLLSGDFVGSRPLLDAALEAATQTGNDRARIIVENSLATLAIDQGRLDAAAHHASEIVRLSERLSSGRFLSYGLNLKAQTHLHRAETDAARTAVGRALAAAEGSAIGFCGPWIYGTAARVAASGPEADALLAEGEALLESGAVAHNHFFFRRNAVSYCLEIGDWDRLEHHARSLLGHIGPETTPWTDYFIGCPRALASVRRGGADARTANDLRRGLAYADVQRLDTSVGDIRAALATLTA